MKDLIKRNGDSGKLAAEAELTTKHLVPDSNGDIIAMDGTRCREIKKDRRRSTKVVTDVLATMLANVLKADATAVATIQLFKFHGSGTSSTAENANQTTLLAEVTPSGGVRPANGTQTLVQSASGGNPAIYESVAQVTYGGAYDMREHGLFSSTTVGAGSLADRSVFSAVNVANLEKIEFTYRISIYAGG